MADPTARQPATWLALRERVARLGAPALGADLILAHFQVYAPPVPVEQIVRALGVRLEQMALAPWSGALNSTASAAKVWVRGSDAPVRQRFTVAHELGHLMLHDLGVAYRDDTFSGGWKEAQANVFAAALLVPQRMLREHFRGQRAKVLASTFEVSEFAMKIQIGKLTGTAAAEVP